jgi:WD40 repeat protein
MELLSMTRDGRRVLANWGAASVDLRVIDLPVQGESGTVRQYGVVSRDSYGSPAILSHDGTRMLAANTTNANVDLIDLSNAGKTADPFPVIASFGTLTGMPIVRFEFDRSGDRFVALYGNGTAIIQNIATPDQAVTFNQYQGAGIATAISPDGSLVAVAQSSGRITIHSGEDGSELTSFDGPQNLDRLVFDDSGRRLRVSTIDAARIYTYSLRSLRSTIFGPNLLAEAGRDGFIPNGNRVFSRNGDAGFRIIDIDSGATVGTLQAATGATGWVSNLDGSRIATLGGRGNISLFREEESPTASGPMPAMADNALRLSADGRSLVVGGRAGELYLARLDGDAGAAGYRLRRLRLPAPALQYEISPDGASIVTAEADGTVSINNLAFGSSSSGTPPDQVQTAGAEPESTPVVQAPAVTVAETVEISGHGAPLTAIALSPDGERLATASLDGRLRITSISWARLIHRLPFAALPSGPESAKLEPQPLDNSPYALMGGQTTSSEFEESQSPGGPFIVVYNASRSLGQAIAARDRAAAAGFPDGLIFRRQGFFRGVFSFATAEASDAALPRIRAVFSGAYARELGSWCPGAARNETFGFLECGSVMAGSAPPAMAN